MGHVKMGPTINLKTILKPLNSYGRCKFFLKLLKKSDWEKCGPAYFERLF